MAKVKQMKQVAFRFRSCIIYNIVLWADIHDITALSDESLTSTLDFTWDALSISSVRCSWQTDAIVIYQF